MDHEVDMKPWRISSGALVRVALLLALLAVSSRPAAAVPPRWQEIGPPPRSMAWLTIDPDRNRGLLLYDDPSSGKIVVWTVPLTGPEVLTELAVQGTPPVDDDGNGQSRRPKAFFDEARDRLVVFACPQTWALRFDTDPPTWEEIATTGSTPSVGLNSAAVIYDPVRDRMIVSGGRILSTYPVWHISYTNATWSLDFATGTWTGLSPSNPPPARAGHAAIYDPTGDRMLIQGGGSVIGFTSHQYDDVWALSLAGSPAWTQLTPSGPGPAPGGDRVGMLDPGGQRMVLVGADFPDNWALDLTQGNTAVWSPLPADPGSRSHPGVAYDATQDRMLMYGGGGRYDLWEFDLGADAWSITDPAFQYLAPAVARGQLVVDPTGETLTLIPGAVVGNFDRGWSRPTDGSAGWAEVPTGSPGYRVGCVAVVDPDGDRALRFSGADVVFRADVWSFDLASQTWQNVTSNPAPQPRVDAFAAWDGARHRMMVHGGEVNTGGLTNDTWAFDAASLTWSQLAVTGMAPRPYQSGIYDPIRDRLLTIGGWTNNGYTTEVRELDLDGGVTWTALATAGTPPPFAGANVKFVRAAYDPFGDRMLA